LPTDRQRWSAREVDRGKVVVGVPVGRSVPPVREQLAGEGERGAAGLRGLRSELGVLEHGVAPAAVAVAWTLTFPGVTGAIVGARSPRQVDGWLPAATLELKDDDLSDIAAAIQATGAGTGPASPVQ
jgi:aryl-alcohol dehydrogenase-like predicted oxidoreductase